MSPAAPERTKTVTSRKAMRRGTYDADHRSARRGAGATGTGGKGTAIHHGDTERHGGPRRNARGNDSLNAGFCSPRKSPWPSVELCVSVVKRSSCSLSPPALSVV